MTGKPEGRRRAAVLSYALCGAFALAACGEDGGFGASGARNDSTMNVVGQSRGPVRTQQDVERPDVFSVTDRGLWDGRPSLGGIWVAHPDVRDPERVVIRNPANGQSTVGALFRRERENPGPALQVSSDAAEELGLLAGAPAELSVVALRRVEIEVAPPPPEDTGEVEGLAAPAAIEASPLDPVDVTADAAATVTDTATTLSDQGPVEVVLPPAPVASAEGAAPVASTSLPEAPIAQIGVFSLRANADGAAAALTAAGFGASVINLEAGGRTVWRVVAGPVPDQEALARIRALGFVDAFVMTSE
ncbi:MULTISPECIES: SPOR domain-containing protein [unclassified Yoonia]|uniref:SPOR domain-containing protein n=1 Tax=unclassified Yoonia TaxID=2629118 RepID=UPI002AFF2FE9|nr:MULTISPECIES: SPOR domain-containing protein [unclassified Yoonia]